MTISFAIIAVLIIASAVAAMTMRNLVHCALSLILTFAGLAALYLQLNAQFVGFAQVLVYVGAVAILIVFAILLTRGSEPAAEPVVSSSWAVGIAIIVAVFGVLAWAVNHSRVMAATDVRVPKAAVQEMVAVKQIGHELMTRFVLPLEVIGLLLTAALIGAVIIAMKDLPGEPKDPA